MSDRPILFSAPMIRALLDGRKTQTRRVIKPQPPADVVRHCWYDAPVYGFTRDHDVSADWHKARLLAYNGDRLWVRESYCGHWCGPSSPASRGVAPGSGRLVTSAKVKQSDGTVVEATEDDPLHLWYRADNAAAPYSFAKWQSSIHMPRWASRLTLIVTDVRVEPLQDLSEHDAIAEGAPLDPDHRDTTQDGSNPNMVRVNAWTSVSPVAWYHRLWNDIHGPGAWEQNPWVAAYTFRVIQQNIDEVDHV